MKTINDLTHEELIKLTDADLQHYVEIEIATKGIKFVQKPELRVVNEVTVFADDPYYEVHGLIVATMEDAQKIASVSVYNTDYDYRMGYDYKTASRKDYGNEIKGVKFYRKENLAKVKELLIANKEIKETNEKLEKEYNKFIDATEGCKKEVYEVYYSACTEEREINNAVTAYKKYLSLADNDQTIALNFFNKAYSDELPEIKNKALIKLGVTQKVTV